MEEHGIKKLYHGTKRTFEKFKTPTGLEKMDVIKGGVVYLTSDITVAKKYAGANGYVCIAEVEDPTPYKDQREIQGLPKKHKKYTRNVYVALPKDIKIIEFIKCSDIE
jgi:hypothetical protein